MPEPEAVTRARDHCSSAPMGRAPRGEPWHEYCMVCAEAWPCTMADLLAEYDILAASVHEREVAAYRKGYTDREQERDYDPGSL